MKETFAASWIYICGLYSLAFAVFHMGFWRLFRWENEVRKLSFANRGILQILNVQLIYYFLFTAFVCFTLPTDLLSSKLGNAFLLANALFWLIRFVQQFIFLRANHKVIHILSVIFLVGAVLFAVPVFTK